MSTPHRLSPEHAEHLARFRISPEMLDTAGVRSVTDAGARETLGIDGHHGVDLAGILFPYLSPITGDRVGGRIRLDHPLPNDGGKYLSERGCRHLFFSPFSKDQLADTSVPVVIVEAEKSALAVRALASRAGRQMLPIAIGGCWGWKRKISNRELPDGGSEPETGPSKDFNLIDWQGRTVSIVFDSNATSNSSVQHARRALAKDLGRRGALVQIAEVPIVEGVNGPDDLIAVSGDPAMLSVLEAARQFVVITLRPGKLPMSVDQAEEILLDHSERLMIFQRASELVRVISLAEPRKGGGLQRIRGTVQLEPLGRVALTEMFDRIVQWQRISSSGDERIVDCPTRIPAAYLSRTDSWRLPVLAGVISAPIMREDGTIVVRPGYDNDTGLFFNSDGGWPAIPDRPTRADAEVAVGILKAPFEEFPFIAEEDLAVHIAAISTAIQRRLLKACPIFGYTAPTQRSGKSLLAEAVAIPATGKPAPATAVSRERDEMRKAITSALREGHSVINLDNIEIPLASPDLAKAITQPEYQDRLLGENRMLRLPTTVLWTATGNNLTFRGDLSSRALLCRIDSGMERPEERTFTNPDLKDFLIRNRKQIVAAVLTILRAYHIAGRPKQDVRPWGGFEDWSRSIREALVWAGLADPCKTRENVLADDPDREESIAVLLALREAFGDSTFTTKEAIGRCEEDSALKDAILAVAAARDERNQIDPKRLGWWCRQSRDRTIGGLQLRRCGKISSKVAHWQVEIRIVDARGQGGQRGYSSTTEHSAQPVDDAYDANNEPGRTKTDPTDPNDPSDELLVTTARCETEEEL